MKMKRAIYSFFLILLSSHLDSQPITFSQTYADTLNWPSISNNVIEINNSFYCLSLSPISSTSYSMLLNVNSYGEVNQRRFINRSSNKPLWGGATLTKASNDCFFTLVAERIVSSSSVYSLKLCKFTSNFDTIWCVQNSDSASEDYAGNILINMDYVYCSGYRRIPNSIPERYRGIMMISDINGNQLDFKEYNIEEISHGFNTIVSGSDNSFLLGGLRYDSLYHGLVVKTDSLGNMLWHRWYPELWGANISSRSD